MNFVVRADLLRCRRDDADGVVPPSEGVGKPFYKVTRDVTGKGWVTRGDKSDPHPSV